MSLAAGAVGRIVTVPAVGSVVATVVVAGTPSLQWFCGSRARTSTLIVSPRSPLPACERSSVEAVAPVIVEPLRFHVYS